VSPARDFAAEVIVTFVLIPATLAATILISGPLSGQECIQPGPPDR